MLKIYIKRISENIGEIPEEFHYDYFKLENGELYYRGKRKPSTTKGVLKSIGILADILGKGGLCNLGFDIPRGKVTAWQTAILNKAAEELPSESDITGADDHDRILISLLELSSSKVPSGGLLYNRILGRHT